MDGNPFPSSGLFIPQLWPVAKSPFFFPCALYLAFSVDLVVFCDCTGGPTFPLHFDITQISRPIGGL